MRKLLFTLIGLLLLTFAGCSNGALKTLDSNIPDLKIISDNKYISVKKGGYEWTIQIGLFKKQSVIADSASPEQIAENMIGDKILSQSQLNLEFSEKPNKVTVIPWGEFKDAQYTSTENIITVPEKEGVYIFEVIGEWTEGKVSYTTKVIIDDN